MDSSEAFSRAVDKGAFLDGRVSLQCGDCLDVLDAMAENSVDSVVTDPPYHLTSIVKRFGADGAAEAKPGATGAYQRASSGFMGKQWDGGDVAFQVETWRKVLRVLKPGGYIVAFASSRGFGRMSVAIEDAGFINHPMFGWIFGSGFPKATRIKAEGYEGFRYGGQATKPALEPVYMGQKPFSEKTGTANILRWGTGALNIDGCRIGTDEELREGANKLWSHYREGEASADRRYQDEGGTNFAMKPGPRGGYPSGRWPANVIHDGSEEVLAAFPETESGSIALHHKRTTSKTANTFGERAAPPEETFGDSGSAARFFYTAKADAEDRVGSKHPTVKPLDLMQYLVRLVTPPRVPYCPQCEGECDAENSSEGAGSAQTVRVVPDGIQAEGQSARGPLLQPTVRGRGAWPTAAAVPVVRNDVPAPEGRGAEILQPGLLGEMGGQEPLDLQGIRDEQSGVSPALDAGPSPVSLSEGLHLRTPLGDAAEDRATSNLGGSGASHQRDEVGQSAGKLGADAQAGPRQAEPSEAEHIVLPPLSGAHRHEPTCPHCGHRLSYRPGLVLDPFAGTGTTGEAAWREGMRAILIEREAEYQADIARRMELAENPTKRAAVAKSKNNLQGAEGTPLFDGVS